MIPVASDKLPPINKKRYGDWKLANGKLFEHAEVWEVRPRFIVFRMRRPKELLAMPKELFDVSAIVKANHVAKGT